MELKALILGLLFSVGIFAIKSGAGLAYVVRNSPTFSLLIQRLLLFAGGYSPKNQAPMARVLVKWLLAQVSGRRKEKWWMSMKTGWVLPMAMGNDGYLPAPFSRRTWPRLK